MEIETIARDLATAHRSADEGDVVAIYWHPHDTQVRLVEVSKSIPTTHEILAFGFAASEQVPAPSVMIIVSEEEFNDLKDGDLQLPDSWGTDAFNKLQKIV